MDVSYKDTDVARIISGHDNPAKRWIFSLFNLLRYIRNGKDFVFSSAYSVAPV